jgi:hypothetical protein
MCENSEGLLGVKIGEEDNKEPLCKMCKTRKTGGKFLLFSFMLNGERQNMFKPEECCIICMTRDFIGFLSSPRVPRFTIQYGRYYFKTVHKTQTMPKSTSVMPFTGGIWGGSKISADNRRINCYIPKIPAARLPKTVTQLNRY